MPVVLSFVDEELQVLLQFLVNSLGLSIGLGVVGCGRGYLNTQELEQLLHECSNELRTSIGDDLPQKAMKLPDVSKVQIGIPSRCSGSDHFDEVSPLTDRVDHYHHRIITTRLRELDNEVNTDDVPTLLRNWKGLQFSDWKATLHFHSKAQVALRGVLTNIA